MFLDATNSKPDATQEQKNIGKNNPVMSQTEQKRKFIYIQL